MSLENPFQSGKNEKLHHLEIEEGFDQFVPVAFKADPFKYFEREGINIKPGDVKVDTSGEVREDPGAVKRLPGWMNGEKALEVVGKKVNAKKGEIRDSGDPLYEYNILKYVRSLGLPAPMPICFAEKEDEALFVSQKADGIGWYEKDDLDLPSKGWSQEEISALYVAAENAMKELAKRFAEHGIKRSWKLKDMVLDIDWDAKKIRSITPTDFERTVVLTAPDSEDFLAQSHQKS